MKLCRFIFFHTGSLIGTGGFKLLDLGAKGKLQLGRVSGLSRGFEERNSVLEWAPI